MDLRGQRCGLQQRACGQVHVEPSPHRRGSGFCGHGGNKSGGFGLQRVGGPGQQGAALARAGSRPGREGGGRGFYGGDGVLHRSGGRGGGHRAVQRIASLEGGTVGCGGGLTVDQ